MKTPKPKSTFNSNKDKSTYTADMIAVTVQISKRNVYAARPIFFSFSCIYDFIVIYLLCKIYED